MDKMIDLLRLFLCLPLVPFALLFTVIFIIFFCLSAIFFCLSAIFKSTLYFIFDVMEVILGYE